MGKVYEHWVDLSEDVSNWESNKMAAGFGRLLIDIDLYDDLENESSSPSGTVIFKAQTSSAASSTATITNGTVDVSDRDYSRPNANGPTIKIKSDLSPITGANFAKISIWRGE